MERRNGKMNLLGENVIKKEKIKMKKKGNHLVERIATTKGKYIVGTCLLSGIGVALPRIFHVLAGSSAGATFLPMHLPLVLLVLVL